MRPLKGQVKRQLVCDLSHLEIEQLVDQWIKRREIVAKNTNMNIIGPLQPSVVHLMCLLCPCDYLREDVAHVGVVGAAERWRSIAAVLYAAFTLGFTAACNTHKDVS